MYAEKPQSAGCAGLSGAGRRDHGRVRAVGPAGGQRPGPDGGGNCQPPERRAAALSVRSEQQRRGHPAAGQRTALPGQPLREHHPAVRPRPGRAGGLAAGPERRERPAGHRSVRRGGPADLVRLRRVAGRPGGGDAGPGAGERRRGRGAQRRHRLPPDRHRLRDGIRPARRDLRLHPHRGRAGGADPEHRPGRRRPGGQQRGGPGPGVGRGAVPDRPGLCLPGLRPGRPQPLRRHPALRPRHRDLVYRPVRPRHPDHVQPV